MQIELLALFCYHNLQAGNHILFRVDTQIPQHLYDCTIQAMTSIIALTFSAANRKLSNSFHHRIRMMALKSLGERPL